MQRTTSQNGSQSNVRSQSQPARTVSNNLQYPYQYQIAYDPVSGAPLYFPTTAVGVPMQENMPLRYMPNYPNSSVVVNDGLPKEYVGYYFNESPQQGPQGQFTTPPVAPIPSYGELAASRRPRPRDLQPVPLNGLRSASRSPSPLGHPRTFSSPLRSAPLPVAPTTSFPPAEYMLQQNGRRGVEESYASRSPPMSDIDFPRELARSVTLDNPRLPSLDPSFEDELARPLPPGSLQFGELLATVPPLVDLPPSSFPPERGLASASTSLELQATSSAGPTIVSSSGTPTPATPPRVSSKALPEKSTIPSLDAPPPRSELRKPPAVEPKTGPVLSPVLETRTPSPTATRRPGRPAWIASVNGVPSVEEGKNAPKANGDVKVPFSGPRPRSRSPQKAVQSRKEPVPPTPAPELRHPSVPGTPKSASLPNFGAAVSGPVVPPAPSMSCKLPVPPTPISDPATLGSKKDGAPAWETTMGSKHRRRRRRQSTSALGSTSSVSGGPSPEKVKPERTKMERKAVGLPTPEEKKGG